MNRSLLVLGILIAVALRLLWLGDMEFNLDHVLTVQGVSELAWIPTSAFSGIGEHSGVPQSVLNFSVIKALSLGSSSPWAMAVGIAAANAFAIGWGLWLARRSATTVLALLFCATSLSMVHGSRHIWVPCLINIWLCPVIAILGARRTAYYGLAGFLLLFSGHMYPPTLLIGVVAAAAMGFSLRKTSSFRSFAWGVSLGILTFVPYGVAILTRDQGVFGPTREMTGYHFGQLTAILKNWATLSSDLTFYGHHFGNQISWMLKHAPSALYNVTLVTIIAVSVSSTALFWAVIARTVKRRREAIQDPLVLTALALFVILPVTLFAVKLGTFLHYWIGAMPFVFYWISWAVHERGTKLKRWAWGNCVAGAVASFFFLWLVHENQGLPGRYGPTYGSQIEAKASGEPLSQPWLAPRE